MAGSFFWRFTVWDNEAKLDGLAQAVGEKVGRLLSLFNNFKQEEKTLWRKKRRELPSEAPSFSISTSVPTVAPIAR